MTVFPDLGLRDELLRTLEDEDIEQPTALQQAVIPVLRRGGNLVARASAGAGKTLAYGLGVLDRLGASHAAGDDDEDAGTPVRVLILRPTPEAAEHTALSLVPYAQSSGLGVMVPGGSWGTPLGAAAVVAATPQDLLAAVRSSSLKLDSVEAVIVDGAAAIQELGQFDALETLLDHLPRDAQRVLLTTTVTAEIDDLVDRRVKRALRYPPEAAVPEQTTAAVEGQIGYILVPESQKLELLARALGAREQGGAAPVLFCRTDERAATVAEALTTRGFMLGDLDEEGTDVMVATSGITREELASETGEEPGQTISYDVPADEATLLARHRGDADSIVLLEPREMPHLREIATRANLRTRSVTLPISSPALSGLSTFREEIRQALREEDLGAQMLVLEPPFEEFSPAEVAAAAASLLRRRRPAGAAASEPDGERQGAAPAAAAAAPGGQASVLPRTEVGPAPASWSRLYVGIGTRDGARPGDLVGAITGEADIPGSRVGKIDIRDSFSIVEVQADVAEKVIGVLNGTTMKGRSLRVDYDRSGDRARKPSPGRRPPGGSPDRGAGGGSGSAGGSGGTRRTIVRRPPRGAE
ncbi:hypothetical protein BH23GEM3_BH23GEM3_03780 [soil metagenome]